MTKQLKITLVRSPIDAVPKQRVTVAALGLRKMHKTVVMPDNVAMCGMVWYVERPVRVEEAEE